MEEEEEEVEEEEEERLPYGTNLTVFADDGPNTVKMKTTKI